MIVDFQKGTMKVVVGMLAVLSTVVGQTCFEGPGGATVSDTKAGGHNIQVLGWRSFMYHSRLFPSLLLMLTSKDDLVLRFYQSTHFLFISIYSCICTFFWLHLKNI